MAVQPPGTHRFEAALVRVLNSAADVLIYCAAFLGGCLLREILGLGAHSLFQRFTPSSLATLFTAFMVSHIIALRLAGTYPIRRIRSFDQMAASYLQATALGVLIQIIIAFFAYWMTTSYVIMLGGSMLAFPLLLLKERGLRETLRAWRKTGFNQRRVLLIGADGKLIDKAAEEFEKDTLLGMTVIGALRADGEWREEKTPVIGELSALGKVLETVVIDAVVFVDFEAGNPEHEAAIWKCEMRGIEAMIRMSLLHRPIDKVFIDRIGKTTYLSFRGGPQDPYGLLIKYSLDRILSAFLLIFGFPVMLLVALIVRLDSPGPVLFRQRRVGLNGRPFTFIKFRSMVTNADELKAILAARNEMTGPMFKIADDPRITRAGRWLRRTSLDELPQLWNVFMGDMSLVGPRPSLPDEVEKFDPWQRRRLSMKPGITCIWQVRGRSEITDFRDWARLDLEYIDHWSLWLDFKLLALTIPAVLFAKGAR